MVVYLLSPFLYANVTSFLQSYSFPGVKQEGDVVEYTFQFSTLERTCEIYLHQVTYYILYDTHYKVGFGSQGAKKTSQECQK